MTIQVVYNIFMLRIPVAVAWAGAMAASITDGAPAAVKSCLCGNVQQGSGQAPRARASGQAKCRVCRTKPRYLNSQRSLDLGHEVEVSHTSPPPSGEPTPTAEVPRRRARSAERYDGMRINTGEQPQPSLELYFGNTSRVVPCKVLGHLMQMNA